MVQTYHHVPSHWARGPLRAALLFALLTHDCTAKASIDQLIKFSDDTTVTGRIGNDDETAYRVEVGQLVGWCMDNNLSLNVGKTKEIIVDHSPLQQAQNSLVTTSPRISPGPWTPHTWLRKHSRGCTSSGGWSGWESLFLHTGPEKRNFIPLCVFYIWLEWILNLKTYNYSFMSFMY